MAPLVTVFIPVYNAEEYLKETIDSVLKQTYTNFEIVIVNDGSTDRSVEIAESFMDPRIHLYHNEGNRGLPYTRNRGLALARGEYIAFLDADDIALPDRLQTEVEFLEKHPEFHLVGSWYHTMMDGIVKEQRFHSGQYRIRNTGMIFRPVVGTSTIMVRKSLILQNKLNYRKECFVAQDYAFLVDCACHTDIVCLSKPLAIYRTGHNNISKRSSEQKMQARRRIVSEIQQRSLKNQGILLEQEQIAVFRDMFLDPPITIGRERMEQGIQVLKEIDRQFFEKGEEGFGTEARQVLFHVIWRMDIDKWEKWKYLRVRFRDESTVSRLLTAWMFLKYSLKKKG